MQPAVRLIISILSCSMICACSDISEDTTTVATATGGAIGAGLGAIVGSQTGNAGAGLAIGAAAGSGAGYLIGQGLDETDQRARASDEIINRRAAVIKSQRQEINSLRTINSDTGSSYPNAAPVRVNKITTQDGYIRKSANTSGARAPSIQEQTIAKNNSIREKADWYRKQESGTTDMPSTTESHEASLGAGSTSASAECTEAEGEFFKGRGAVQSAEKLIALKRSVRLCPSDVRFQLALGQAYKNAGNKSDAIYQYKQTLKLEPRNSTATQALRELGN